MRKYLIAGLLLIPSIALAQNLKLDTITPGLGTDVWDFIHIIISILKWFVIPVIVIVIIYSGFQMTTAGGDIKKVDSAKHMLYGAVAGAATLFASDLIVDIVRNTGENILN